MSEQYKKLTLHEALDAKLAGIAIEHSSDSEYWHSSSNYALNLNWEYRKLVKPLPPEKKVAHEGWVHPDDFHEPTNRAERENLVYVREVEDE